MFEKWRIREHMEVVDSTGRHIGTVDETDDERIKLTRSDAADGEHHYLDWDSVDRIAENRVYLKPEATQGLRTPEPATTAPRTEPLSSADESIRGTTPDLPGEDRALFGTSGHGTGMGGGGTR